MHGVRFGHCVALAFAMTLAGPLTVAQTPKGKPKVPPGAPQPGLAVALISTGIDYTRPGIARRLARDGEGELIGWDLVDDDRRPYAPAGNATLPEHGGDATALVERVVPLRIVPLRVDPTSAGSLAAAVRFIRTSPARVVVVPMWSRSRATWEPFRAAADEARDLLFIVAAGDDGDDIDARPVYPASFGLANVLVVSALAPEATAAQPNHGARSVDAIIAPPAALREAPGTAGASPRNSREAAMLAAGLIACHAASLAAATSPAAAKRILVALGKRVPPLASPIIEACAPSTDRVRF